MDSQFFALFEDDFKDPVQARKERKRKREEERARKEAEDHQNAIERRAKGAVFGPIDFQQSSTQNRPRRRGKKIAQAKPVESQTEETPISTGYTSADFRQALQIFQREATSKSTNSSEPSLPALVSLCSIYLGSHIQTFNVLDSDSGWLKAQEPWQLHSTMKDNDTSRVLFRVIQAFCNKSSVVETVSDLVLFAMKDLGEHLQHRRWSRENLVLPRPAYHVLLSSLCSLYPAECANVVEDLLRAYLRESPSHGKKGDYRCMLYLWILMQTGQEGVRHLAALIREVPTAATVIAAVDKGTAVNVKISDLADAIDVIIAISCNNREYLMVTANQPQRLNLAQEAIDTLPVIPTLARRACVSLYSLFRKQVEHLGREDEEVAVEVVRTCTRSIPLSLKYGTEKMRDVTVALLNLLMDLIRMPAFWKSRAFVAVLTESQGTEVIPLLARRVVDEGSKVQEVSGKRKAMLQSRLKNSRALAELFVRASPYTVSKSSEVVLWKMVNHGVSGGVKQPLEQQAIAVLKEYMPVARIYSGISCCSVMLLGAIGVGAGGWLLRNILL